MQIDYAVTRIVEFGNGVEHDCAVPDSCVLVSVYPHGFKGRAVSTLQFRPGPAVSAWPHAGLAEGQQIQVKGYGYGAGASVGIEQCPTGATAQDQCDGRTAQSLSADDAGSFTRQMTVHRVITDAHGVVTDSAVPGSCVVASVSIHGFADRASDGLAVRRPSASARASNLECQRGAISADADGEPSVRERRASGVTGSTPLRQ